jgi:hypothetical protein
MKLILTLAFGSCFLLGNTQTPLIAHKSHAGSSNSYSIASSSNFGRIEIPENFQPQIPPTTEKFKQLNDSVMIVEVTDIEQNIIQIDTLPNQNRYSIVLFEYKYRDSIKKLEYQEKEYQLKIEEEAAAAEKKRQLESQKQINEPAPVKKKKKSFLLFLFGITGGGMLLMKLFGRSRSIKPSIA